MIFYGSMLVLRFFMVLGDLWWFLGVLAGFGVFFCGFWWFLVAHGGCWWL